MMSIRKAKRVYTRKGCFDMDTDMLSIAAAYDAGYTIKRVVDRGVVYVVEWEGF